MAPTTSTWSDYFATLFFAHPEGESTSDDESCQQPSAALDSRVAESPPSGFGLPLEFTVESNVTDTRSGQPPGRATLFRNRTKSARPAFSTCIPSKPTTTMDLPISIDPELSQEARIQLAITAVAQQKISERKAAHLFNVPRSTLQARSNGRRSAKEAQQSQQRLSIQEEESIKRCIRQMAAWGWPTTIRYLEGLVKKLLQARGDLRPLGQNWYKNFLARNPDVKLKPTRCLDQSRMDASSYTILENWFTLYTETCAKYGICMEDQYNMDEKGFMKGVGDNTKVLLPVEEEEAWSIQPGNREWVSVIECIGMSGYLLPAFIIFQGKQIQQSWISSQVNGQTVIQVSPAGWTDRAIALSWLKHFDDFTRPRTIGQYRLLILDGHTSHTSLEFTQLCEDSKIIPLCLPPHSTHILQPLDIGIFSPLAKAYKKKVQQHSLFGAQRISNNDFLLFYQEARQTILRNIPSAWRGAGLMPYNPSSILQKYRPKTPPVISLTNEDGVQVSIQPNQDLSRQINELVASILQGAPPKFHSPIRRIERIGLTAIADRTTFEAMNSDLIEKQRESRKKKTKKNFGEARVLTVDEALKKQHEREAREREQLAAKERAAALRGKVGFAKLAWKELPMSFDVFTL